MFKRNNKINIGREPWNKGLTKETNEMLKIVSERNKGIHFTPHTQFKKGHNSGMTGKKHSIKTKLKMSNTKKKLHNNGEIDYFTREARINQLEYRKNVIFPKKDSKIEIKIQNFLEQLGVDYLKHKYMNIKHSYRCDIFIPSLNLVIECDGNYWHKYPTRRDIDNIRTNELIAKGFKILRLWENEIKEMDIDKFKEIII